MELYSCDFWRVELAKHRKKLLKLTWLSETGLAELEHLVTANITFINEGLLPGKLLERTEDFLKDIDINDTPFVALAKHLDGTLWTGDLALYKGLKAKRFKQVITTAEPALLLDKAALR